MKDTFQSSVPICPRDLLWSGRVGKASVRSSSLSRALRGEQELTRGNVCMEGRGISAVLTEGDIMGLWTPGRSLGDGLEGREGQHQAAEGVGTNHA